MSTEAISDDPPEAGLAWITLLLSSGLLGALFVWSLQNPSVLLPALPTVERSDRQPEGQPNERSDVQSASRVSAEVNVASDIEQLNIEQPDVENSELLLSPSTEAKAAMNPTTPETQQSIGDTNLAAAVLPESDASVSTPLERLKRQELATLPGLAGRVRFNPEQTEPLEGSDELLNRMFELLFLYIDSEVVVKISSADFEDDVQNLELSKTRAQSLVAYLVDRGLDEKRFDIVPLGREQLPLGGHRVNVYAKDI